MADDRLFLKCNLCGEKLPLGKQFMGAPFFLDDNGKDFAERLNRFYAAHQHFFSDSPKWYGDYSLKYETDEEESE